MGDFNLIDSLLCNIGKTVTIFTESGGLSGSGFTGVLASVVDGNVRLITDIGAAPACAECYKCLHTKERKKAPLRRVKRRKGALLCLCAARRGVRPARAVRAL